MRDGNGLPAKFFSRRFLDRDLGLDGDVRRHPIVDTVDPQLEVRALKRNHDLLVGLDLRGDSIDDGYGGKRLGGCVDHDRFDVFPHMEFMGAIAPIRIRHCEIGEGGIEGQLHGVGQTRTQVR